LGFYLQATEGARYWGLVLEDMKKRGVEDVLFFCVDGLSGFKEVITQVYPMSIIQRCIVHMVRTSTRFVSDKDLRAICVDLRKIYNAADRDQAAIALEAFGEKWDKKYKEIRPKWEENWDELMAFMDYSENIRRMIYTTKKDKRPKTKDQRQKTKDKRPKTKDQRQKTKDKRPKTKDQRQKPLGDKQNQWKQPSCASHPC
jgi:transposase-like protein